MSSDEFRGARVTLMKKPLITFFLVLVSFSLSAQSKRVLFLGNSYTYVNNLPLIISRLALSGGDSLYTESNTPGGYTLGWQPIAHSTDPVSLAKIREGNWDFVVLQEQSQTPAIPVLRDSCMFPASTMLYDSVHFYNPCGHILFYQTWGRRFGGIQCFVPNYCSTNFADFNQMQDSLTRAYCLISKLLNEPVAPAGETWRLIINNTTMVLHGNDDSHPNLNGSYVTACVFYSTIFKKHSYGLTFTAGLLPDSAAILQKAADSVVFTNPAFWNLWENVPVSAFSVSLLNDKLITSNLSLNSFFYRWDFGDGTFSTEFEPEHIYNQNGTFNVILQACDSCNCDTAMKTVVVTISSTGSGQMNGSVEMKGPDNSGNIHFTNFNGDGFMELIDISGKIISDIPVKNGRSVLPAFPQSVYFWVLYNKGKKMGSGKIISKS